ncbi:glycosyltransferase [Sphingomonas sp.]|uniref:glycosyltransferase n=1 Tax=Sphingomonas sp. TaxID=28214 RepID=UPI001B1DC8A6|nr:glycosyltransferase [Sphingomonas sp.]MBO9713187.1 glycosyltransferase [Sphingomonas sp.]
MEAPAITVAVLAHNEERRIAACLESLPLGRADVAIHVAVNGSSDSTADIAEAIAARAGNLTVHRFAEGGKARSWNRLVLDELPVFSPAHVFVDGDAEVLPGAIDALAAALAADPQANGASGFPDNGRGLHYYEGAIEEEHGLFGDLYALKGSFLARMKAAGVRLPVDLVGDDGLIGALAKIDLGTLADWQEARQILCPAARFRCEPVSLVSPRSWRMQYRRMINYSLRHYQNALVSEILRTRGAAGLPERLAPLYPELLAREAPRLELSSWWFDRLALARMAKAA